MRKQITLILFLFFISFALSAQDKVTNTFGFSNGIYKTFEEFKNNKPSISWGDVSSDLIVMESIHKAKMGNLLLTTDSNSINIGNVWGFSVNGLPYKRVLEQESNGFYVFSGLQLRGKICYYEYEVVKQVPIEVSAYNPLTGKPFRTSTVIREKTIDNKYLLDFSTGNEDLFTLESVEKWIASDDLLLTTFKETAIEERAKKLLKFIQIFNDRNEVLIKQKD